MHTSEILKYLARFDMASSRICLTWTKWPNYEKGLNKNLRKPKIYFCTKKELLFTIQ